MKLEPVIIFKDGMCYSIYYVIEQVMNGTGTVETYCTGIRATTFCGAKAKLDKLLKNMYLDSEGFNVDIIEDTDEIFSYTIHPKNLVGISFPVRGIMKNKIFSAWQ